MNCVFLAAKLVIKNEREWLKSLPGIYEFSFKIKYLLRFLLPSPSLPVNKEGVHPAKLLIIFLPKSTNFDAP